LSKWRRAKVRVGRKQDQMKNRGKVYIIGAGPGDYKLLTLKAIECISKADVVVYDRLVGSKVLKYAREDAELVYVGKMPDCHAVPQEKINGILASKALEGKTVARVKGGDPFVFGRGGEECETLVENGIEFEIIPGITSAIAVPAYAGIPVTHRDWCSSFHVITGHERPDKDGSSLDYEVLAKLKGTLIFLMGIKNLNDICSNLIKHGKSGSTPAAVIERGTTCGQKVVTGTLEDISKKVKELGIKSPAVTVVGSVAGLREKLDWFPKGVLAGKKVVVTRSREQASTLVEKIEELGGEALEFPTIRIVEPESYEKFDSVLSSIREFYWIVFTSVNGVKSFFKRMKLKRIDIRELGGLRLCAVGEATADGLSELGLNVDFMPEKYTTEEVLKGLLKLVKPGEKVLLARADIANPVLSEGLKEKGIDMEELVVYRTAADGSDRDEVLSLLEGNKVDFITFTSSSTVKNFVSIVGEENLDRLSGSKVVCIGPVTADTARDLGIDVAAVAEVYTIDGLVQKLVESLELRVESL